jgi:hypothetical protein
MFKVLIFPALPPCFRKLLEKEQRKKQEQAEQAELISSSSIVEETP